MHSFSESICQSVSQSVSQLVSQLVSQSVSQRLSVDYNAMRAFVYVLIPLEREHCNKMARFELFSSQERK